MWDLTNVNKDDLQPTNEIKTERMFYDLCLFTTPERAAEICRKNGYPVPTEK